MEDTRDPLEREHGACWREILALMSTERAQELSESERAACHERIRRLRARARRYSSAIRAAAESGD